MTRSVTGLVATFYVDSSRRLRVHSLTAFTKERSHGGHGDPYIARSEYDVDWCRTYGCYLIHLSGCGGNKNVDVDGPYYLSGDVTVIEKPTQVVDHRDSPSWEGEGTKRIRARNKTRRLRRLPAALKLEPGENLLDWMDANAIHDEAVFCADCRDYLPGDQLCKHCWWCDNTGWYSTPTERCSCESRDVCMEAAA